MNIPESTSTSTTTSSSTSAKQQSQPPKPNMDYWVEPVSDSSRYFAVRISDENTGRELHVGMGFRERNEALNFKMSLQEYENIMRKEAMARAMSDSSTGNSTTEKIADHADEASSLSHGELIGGKGKDVDISSESIAAVSRLSLKDGEKIHVNLLGASTKVRSKKSQQDVGNMKPPLLLRKPPSSLSMASNSSGGQAIVFNADLIRSNRSGISGHDVSSVIALAETMDTDDEWGDFESVPSAGFTED